MCIQYGAAFRGYGNTRQDLGANMRRNGQNEMVIASKMNLAR